MKITLDQQAIEIINQRLGESAGQVRLVYDTEGCGCYGITVLHLVDEPLKHDEPIENADFTFWIDPQRAVFYEDEMTLSGDPITKTFRLAGNSQIYSSNVGLEDMR